MTDRLAQRLIETSEFFIQDFVERARCRVHGGHYGSPIEELFASAASMLMDASYPQIALHLTSELTEEEFRACCCIGEPFPIELGPRRVACMAPQVRIGGYRVDFLLLHDDGLAGLGGIVVECDGHEFHEKTKEQAARDKARDRALQRRGLKVFRFAGSEVWSDPIGCANQVLDYAATAAGIAGNIRYFASVGNIDAVRASVAFLNQH